MIHERQCPFASVELGEAPPPPAEGGPRAPDQQLTCPDRRCCTWLDLHTWFGLEAPELTLMDFRIAFTDVAHGGTGVYEKLVVLGTRALEMFADLYVNEQFDPTGIPTDLLGNTTIPEEITRKVWTRKRVERLLTPHALWTFAKAYLATAQSLPTATSCVKYVRACIGYSIQLPELEAQRIFTWMPTLVEHIYWAQRLHVEEHDEDNELLQDVQEYFGYPYAKLVPRIRDALLDPARRQIEAQTGAKLLQTYAYDYFGDLAEEANIPADQRTAWITDETQEFLNSRAATLFAGCWLNLGPFLAVASVGPTLPPAATYTTAFKSLVAACYVLSPEDHARIWMGALIHRLRQTQLLLRLRQLDILTGGPTADLEYFKGVDIHRWSSLSHLLQTTRRYGWAAAGLDDIAVGALGPSRVAALMHEAERGTVPKPALPPQPTPARKGFGEILCDHLQQALVGRAPPSAPPPEQLPKAPQAKIPPPLAPPGAVPTGAPWQSVVGQSVGPPDAAAAEAPRRIAETAPAIFRRIRHSSARRTLPTQRYCPKDVWPEVPKDATGTELWRPPGAIFMRPRPRRSVTPAPPVARRGDESPSTTPSAEGRLSQSSPPTTTTTTTTSEGDAEDNMKMRIKFRVPKEPVSVAAERPAPVHLVMYESEEAKQKKDPALTAVLDLSPEERAIWKEHGILPGKRVFKATLYGRNHEPVELAFAPSGPTGSPRIYITGSNSRLGTHRTLSIPRHKVYKNTAR